MNEKMDPQQCIRVLADHEQINSCRQKLGQMDEAVDNLARQLALAGNSTRFKILFLLHNEQKLCVCDLADILQLKTPAVSHHLRKLRDAGTIKGEKKGQTIFYMLTPESATLLAPFFEQLAPRTISKSSES